MDLLFILRDAVASSAVGTLGAAMDARSAGKDVAVLVTQEALAALAGGTFEWPRLLAGQKMRVALAEAAKELDYPVFARGIRRQLDPCAMVTQALEAGVRVYACPLWSTLLRIEDSPPEGLESIDRKELVNLFIEARRVVGGL